MNTVAIWKNEWLPYTETFIRDQIDTLTNWSAIRVGYSEIENPLVSSDFTPYPNGIQGKIGKNLFGCRPWMNRYLDLLERSEAKVIHAHFGQGGIAALPLAQASGLPLITTFHGADTHRSGRRIIGDLGQYRRKIHKVFDESHFLIAASEYLANRLLDNGAPAEKIVHLPIGTRVDSVNKIVGERNGVVFVGRLVSIKGPDDLLQAMSLLPERIRDSTRITIVGDGPMRGDLENLASRTGLRVVFTGKVSSAEVSNLLDTHAVFCGPSKASSNGTREGLGMVFLEAAQHALPVVAYASGGVTEAVEHGSSGLLADEGDVRHLADSLFALLADSQMAMKFGSLGRMRILEGFDVVKQTKKLESIYAKCI